MKFERVYTNYSVEVPLEEFSNLLEFENPWNDACRADETLYSKLLNIGVESDYDGHYSNIISITICEEDDNNEFQTQVASIITEQLKTAFKWKISLDNENQSV